MGVEREIKLNCRKKTRRNWRENIESHAEWKEVLIFDREVSCVLNKQSRTKTKHSSWFWRVLAPRSCARGENKIFPLAQRENFGRLSFVKPPRHCERDKLEPINCLTSIDFNLHFFLFMDENLFLKSVELEKSVYGQEENWATMRCLLHQLGHREAGRQGALFVRRVSWHLSAGETTESRILFSSARCSRKMSSSSRFAIHFQLNRKLSNRTLMILISQTSWTRTETRFRSDDFRHFFCSSRKKFSPSRAAVGCTKSVRLGVSYSLYCC